VMYRTDYSFPVLEDLDFVRRDRTNVSILKATKLLL